MSKNLGVVTSLGLTLLMSATLCLVQGCKDKPETTTTTTTTTKPGQKSLTFSSSPIADAQAKDGAIITAIGRNGTGDTFYIAGETAKALTTATPKVIGIWDGKGEPVYKDIIANEQAKNANPADFKWTYGGLTGEDVPNFIAILPGPGGKAAAFANGLGYATGEVSDDRAGVLELDGSDIKAGWRNNNTLMTGASNTENFAAVAVNKNGWIGLFDASTGGYAHASWGDYTGSAKAAENKNGIAVAAAADDGGNLYVTPKDIKGQGIYKTTVGGIVDFSTNPHIAGSALGIADDKSNRISALAVVDGKLLVGQKVSGTTSEVSQSGGVRAIDLATLKVSGAAGLGKSVKKIRWSVDGKSAYIITDKEPVYYVNGKFYESNNFVDIGENGGASFTNNPLPAYYNANDATFNKDGGIYVAVGNQVYEVEAKTAAAN